MDSDSGLRLDGIILPLSKPAAKLDLLPLFHERAAFPLARTYAAAAKSKGIVQP
jgi:hypothetical protein